MDFGGRRVLVTGGAGFIGSHIVDSLVQKGARVRVLDDFSSGLLANLAEVQTDVEVIRGDVRDLDSVRQAAQGMHVISHQAAQLEITTSLADPLADLLTNTQGTLNVLQAARECGVEQVINASSACVYGQARADLAREEEHSTDPNWPYGVSKLAGEKYARLFGSLHGVPVTSLRYSIVYGEREWYGRVLTIFLRRLLEGKPPVVFGQGEQVRDFLYVRDLVALHDRLIAEPLPECVVLNVSTGQPTTIHALAVAALDVTGVRADVVHEAVLPGERSRQVDEERLRLPAELQRMCLDPSKAERSTGWRALVSLRAGLKREWEWLQANRQRWTRMSY